MGHRRRPTHRWRSAHWGQPADRKSSTHWWWSAHWRVPGHQRRSTHWRRPAHRRRPAHHRRPSHRRLCNHRLMIGVCLRTRRTGRGLSGRRLSGRRWLGGRRWLRRGLIHCNHSSTNATSDRGSSTPTPHRMPAVRAEVVVSVSTRSARFSEYNRALLIERENIGKNCAYFFCLNILTLSGLVASSFFIY